MKIRLATRKGWVDVPKGGVFDASYPKSKSRRGRYQQGICPTIMANNMEIYVYEGENEDRKNP